MEKKLINSACAWYFPQSIHYMNLASLIRSLFTEVTMETITRRGINDHFRNSGLQRQALVTRLE